MAISIQVSFRVLLIAKVFQIIIAKLLASSDPSMFFREKKFFDVMDRLLRSTLAHKIKIR